SLAIEYGEIDELRVTVIEIASRQLFFEALDNGGQGLALGFVHSRNQRQVNVRIDEARNEKEPLGVEHFRGAGRGAGADGDDTIVSQDDIGVGKRAHSLRAHDSDIPDDGVPAHAARRHNQERTGKKEKSTHVLDNLTTYLQGMHDG